MPWPLKYKTKALEKSYQEGAFTEETLDDLIRRNLRVMMLTGLFDTPEKLPQGSRNTLEHQEIARRVAEEGMVLVKNEDNILPLDIDSFKRISMHGKHMHKKFGRLLKGGSSAVSSPHEVTPLEGLAERVKGKVELVTRDKLKQALTELAIVFVGLDHGRGGDSESADRDSLHLPEKQVRLIKNVAKEHRKTIVCVIAGSPIAMDEWIDDVETVLMCWYGGMEAGHAIANVLFGDVNPSGKLPLTFPKKLSDSPAHSTGDPKNFPGDEEKRVFYDEGIFVGYRWFDEKNIEPLFPFGFGKSYTTFEFNDVQLSKSNLKDIDDKLSVEVGITNTGNSAGAEVIQVYSHDIQASVERPPRELVGFEKVFLKPGETKSTSILVKADDLAFYDVGKHDWTVEPGDFKFLIGNSSRAIHLDAEFSFG